MGNEQMFVLTVISTWFLHNLLNNESLPNAMGLLWGRGSGDMKDGIALISLLMKDLCAPSKPLAKKFLLMITADEEVGGKNGVEYLTTHCDMVEISCSFQTRCNRHEIVIGEKGVINLTLTATGKAGHSSRPWKYENAIEKLYLAYASLKERIETPELSYSHQIIGDVAYAAHDDLSCGQASNMIPGEATGTLNIRFTEVTTFEWDYASRVEEVCCIISATVSSHVADASEVYSLLIHHTASSNNIMP
jgi:succinyl-diaminopimelate desuccinylase